MTYAGTAHGRVVELEDGVELPEGTRVRVIPDEHFDNGEGEQGFDLSQWLEETRKFRETLPVTSDSVDILRRIREERASR